MSKTEESEHTNMKQTPWLAHSIDRTSRVPVFEQICQAIRSAAISGDLAEGARLPPTRVFATELGVSRSTVVTAYDQLVAEGYLSARQGAGHTVCAIGEVELPGNALATPGRPEQPAPPPASPPVPFEAGQPDMRLFPHRQWARAVARVCRADPQAMLVGGSGAGNPDLRRAIADHVAEWRGIQASPQQIIVTAGSADALELCMRTLASQGDRIGLENPGYLPVRDFAAAIGLVPSYLDLDDQGAHLPATGAAAPRLVMLTPSHQYPLGGAMSPARRLDFIRWARASDSWIIEDDYDSEFRFAGRPIPALAGFDRLDRTVYVGSFSKIFSNALRLGYLIVPEALTDRFQIQLHRAGVKASYMPQQALAGFMHSGEFYRHLRRVRRTYAERRRFMLDQLTARFTDFGQFHDHQAGMQIVLHLRGGADDVAFAHAAAAQGISAQPLSEFYAAGAHRPGLLLGCCTFSPDEMSPALDRLHALLSQNA